MPGQSCVICGRGYGTGTIVHIFPNPTKFPERFREWVHIVGGNLETPADYEYYKKKRICDIHFKDKHKTSCHRLSVYCSSLPLFTWFIKYSGKISG
ncbi:unnamed protein product [Diatraea saccharalis]|uniref:THAP-type domain-containing protein n=1 Tax=Diatraea saccharalis TaxID=40085 RepID=A0A9N9W5G7_9NEOP|nr:unnamed protein product [Diatraea saccharalis]